MQKACTCGHVMKLKLRTVIYDKLIEIDNVPIYSCDVCSHSEVIPEIKSDLTELIHVLGVQPKKRVFAFNECNEWANILYEHKQTVKAPSFSKLQIKQLVEERTNELLDLYLLAQSLKDDEWTKSIQRRLFQLGPQLK